IIKALREGLTANRIDWIAGIINGTSNFILSEMRRTGAAFAMVLQEAQARGYAEADPTFDVEGISKLMLEDIRYAEELGYRIKLLGITRRASVGQREGIELRVHPTLVPST